MPPARIPFGRSLLLCLWAGMLIATAEISALGFLLHTGEYFESRGVREAGRYYVVRHAKHTYLIPKSDVRETTAERTRPEIEAVVVLRDGRSIRGVIAREDAESYTVRTGAGFEVLPKSVVGNVDYRGETGTSPPARYRVPGPSAREYSTALSASVFVGRSPAAPADHPALFGLGLSAEPNFLSVRGIDLGYRLEFASAPGPESAYLLLNNFLYATRDYRWGAWRLWGQLGAGFAYVQYSGPESRAGMDPALYAAFGPRLSAFGLEWQAGLRWIILAETGRIFQAPVFEFGAVLRW